MVYLNFYKMKYIGPFWVPNRTPSYVTLGVFAKSTHSKAQFLIEVREELGKAAQVAAGESGCSFATN